MATDAAKYKLNHSMLRIKDPLASLKYYEFLGMKQIKKLQFPENRFDLYFLAYDPPNSASHGAHWTDRQGVLELTHNYGTENDDNFKIANGNSDPGKGFGHVCISVDDIQAACQRIEDAGYRFHKKLSEGLMREIAFALDPDDYWIEIIEQNALKKTEGVKKTNLGTYRFNHTMLRVKDATTSLKFYQETMGMHLLRTVENGSNGFTLYFLGYYPTPSSVSATASLTGLLELTWNHGTDHDPAFAYHDGNAEPQGFGHICVSVDDLEAACARFEAEGVRWKKRLTDGRMKNVAFILDPDGYWIEVIQNETFKKSADW